MDHLKIVLYCCDAYWNGFQHQWSNFWA